MAGSRDTPTLSAPRYCAVALPAYRFRPGRHPHPTAHPDGHSYHAPGAGPAPETLRPPASWNDSVDYAYGCDLYNHAYWWEAHEAWEGLWQQTHKPGPQGQFLQTLIQTAACHLKIEMGRRDGVASLLVSSTRHYQQFCRSAPAVVFMGLDHGVFFGAYTDYVTGRLAAAVLAHDPAAYPYLTVPFS